MSTCFFIPPHSIKKALYFRVKNYTFLMAQAVFRSPSLSYSSTDVHKISVTTSTIFGSKLKCVENKQTHLRLLKSFQKDIFLRLQTNVQPSGLNPRDKSNPALRLRASTDTPGLTQKLTNNKQKSIEGTLNGGDPFNEMKHRFLSFKNNKYLENLERYQNLAKEQAPKFLVISCADSRVCPSYILGFQPGEAFVVRNIANLVPTFESGPSETKAALEFTVNVLEVPNILVIGHSCCGGIRALMSIQDEVNSSSFIKNWVVVGNKARLSTKAVASHLSFDQQCRLCEKESLNGSLLNLLTYPWIEEKVANGLLSIHGGYYDFVDCTFEKWSLDYQRKRSSNGGSGGFSIKDREFWW